MHWQHGAQRITSNRQCARALEITSIAAEAPGRVHRSLQNYLNESIATSQQRYARSKQALGEGVGHHRRRQGASRCRERCKRALLSSANAVAHERFTTTVTIGVSPLIASCGACNGRRLALASAHLHAHHHRVKMRAHSPPRLARRSPRVGDDGDVGEPSHSAQCNHSVNNDYSTHRRRSGHTGHRKRATPSNHGRRTFTCSQSLARSGG